ncbi:GEL complex subunit OPTI [Malaya genurostris]|uniref:GEL complex subunit OPTI n=1 Tax=Malaya genurostris TaxID=325434 RepID=UPI0026F3811D|nr:GEL complex subunit OPTI [Malaya genurostris]
MVIKSPPSERKAKAEGSDLKSICNRAIKPNSEWIEKDDFLDVIYWARQIIGILVGIVMGIVPLKGFIALALFAIMNCAIIYFYCTSFQSIDEESYGGMWEIIKEGFMTSFACFLVTWIIFYTGIHFGNVTEKIN